MSIKSKHKITLGLSSAVIVAMLFAYSAACWIRFDANIIEILKNHLGTTETASCSENYTCRTSGDIGIHFTMPAFLSGSPDEIYNNYLTDGETPVEMPDPADDPSLKASDAGSGEDTTSTAGSGNAISALLTKFESIWTGNIPLKKNLSRLDTVATYLSTGEISAVQTIRGDGGWLFYGTTTDGDTIADYEGTNIYDSDELDYICQGCTYDRQQLDARGIRYVIMIAPNKEHIYSEYMPDEYTEASVSNSDTLCSFLADNGINMSSPKDNLLAAHSDYQLYYKYDTHWNQLGAYIGVRDALAKLGIDIPSLEDREVSSHPLKDNPYAYVKCDLAAIAGLSDFFTDDTEYIVDGTYSDIDWEEYEHEQNEECTYSHYTNPDAPLQKTMLLVGDSFRTMMLPSLCQEFSDVYVIHRNYYDSSMLDEIKPDYLIAEYVERYVIEMNSVYRLTGSPQ